MDYSEIKDMNRLVLTNAVSISALVGLLVRKGIITEEEMLREVQRLKEKLEGAEAP